MTFVALDPKLKPHYNKLRISAMDLSQALDCAKFLLKKGWHFQQWERARGSTYLQQSAFTTSLVVSYARPFTTARGLPGLPSRLIRWSNEEKALHDRIMRLRNEVYAHSDGASYYFEPWKGETLTTVIQKRPALRLSRDETLAFVDMAERLLDAVKQRMMAIFPAQ